MADTVNLEVATPTGLAFRGEVQSLQVPSVNGEFGMLPNHLPLLAALRPGVLKYQVGGKTHALAIGAGFVEVGSKKVSVLCDACKKPEQIQVAEVGAKLTALQKDLSEMKGLHEGREYDELSRQLQWQEAQIAAKAIETGSA